MGLIAFCLGGLGFIGIGARQAFSAATTHLNLSPSPSPFLSPPLTPTTTTTKSLSHSLDFLAIATFSILHILYSAISFFKGLQIGDHLGVALQLEVTAVTSLFFLYSLAGLLLHCTNFLPLPTSVLNLIAFFAFAQEFLLFYFQRKDPNGLENRYFSLLLVPISFCIFSTLLHMGCPKSPLPSLIRGVGLILQGTWFIQMGFSFFTRLISDGCDLHEKSSANYTIKCKGHAEYHRSRGIATLQFNCHLAFLVVSLVGFYSILSRKHPRVEYLNYKPLNLKDQSEELQEFSCLQDRNQIQFTLDSDEEEMEENKEPKAFPHSEINGLRAH